MEESAFKAMHDAESGWWYDARIFAITRILRRFKAHDESICDVGAGYGAMIPALRPFGSLAAFEPDEKRREECAQTNPGTVSHGDFKRFIAENEGRFSLVTLFDVVEHVEDDLTFLKDIRTTISSGGHVLITVPALQLLWSDFDVRNKHFRRYTKKTLQKVVTDAGFEVEFASFWNMLMLIPTLMVRRSSGASTIGMPRYLDRIFFNWVRLESRLIPTISLPIGTSVFLYARKK